MYRFGKILLLAAFAALPYGVTGSTADGDYQPETVVTETVPATTVAVLDGSIYITAAENTTIKIYTILGNLVLEKKIPAGTTQIQLKARGIYLINTGDSIKRISL